MMSKMDNLLHTLFLCEVFPLHFYASLKYMTQKTNAILNFTQSIMDTLYKSKKLEIFAIIMENSFDLMHKTNKSYNKAIFSVQITNIC